MLGRGNRGVPVILSVLGPNLFLRTLFSNTLSLRSYLNVNDQVQHPYKTISKIIFLIYWNFRKKPLISGQKGRLLRHLFLFLLNILLCTFSIPFTYYLIQKFVLFYVHLIYFLTSTQKTETIDSSEIFVPTTKTTNCHIPKTALSVNVT
jgi:hypothetical protein